MVDVSNLIKPVNKTTAMAMSGGDGFEYTLKKSDHFESELPLPVYKEIPSYYLNKSTTFKDLTNKRFGRFTVVGLYSGERNKKKPMPWVVRCDCGAYCIRKSKAINNPSNVDDCCRACRKTKHYREYK